MEITPLGSIIFEWIFTIVPLIFVVLRLYVRYLQQIFTLSDFFVVLSWVTFTYLTIIDTYLYKLGIWGAPGVHFAPTGFPGAREILKDDGKLVVIYKLFYAGGLFYYTSLWSIKAAFILLYYKMMARSHPALKMVLHATAVLTAASFVVIVGFNFFWCWPLNTTWKVEEEGHCWPFPSLAPYFTCLGMHIATDVLIYSIPFPLIKSLFSYSTKQRIGVGLMFALGGLCILCTIGRSASIGSSFTLLSVGAWTSAEQATAIAVCCCPPLKWLYRSRRPGAPRQMVVFMEEREGREFGTINISSLTTTIVGAGSSANRAESDLEGGAVAKGQVGIVATDSLDPRGEVEMRHQRRPSALSGGRRGSAWSAISWNGFKTKHPSFLGWRWGRAAVDLPPPARMSEEDEVAKRVTDLGIGRRIGQ